MHRSVSSKLSTLRSRVHTNGRLADGRPQSICVRTGAVKIVCITERADLGAAAACWQTLQVPLHVVQ